ncbi:GntR family transcriptional regulator [Alkalibaculum sp. M08DMB]|uniref:GntR family transcriptional regulator n=1 Tax=Alkalibaculum sporogenes TaxID=2655001 RepID=A0A6A7KAA1_9FIRM|nr:GntR family transcriptional regulator [Alkalibaculum sporogenes]MPW26469.1 GntR family transcriptional regulator [Alkalibaculum sporogenes]
MILNTDGSKPIYIQISEWIETEILRGDLNSDQKVYSQYQLAEMFNINPATAAKGLNILVDENIIYKKRGLGMFVSTTAQEFILNKRKTHTLQKLIDEIVLEAGRLNVDEWDLFNMIKTANKRRRKN